MYSPAHYLTVFSPLHTAIHLWDVTRASTRHFRLLCAADGGAGHHGSVSCRYVCSTLKVYLLTGENGRQRHPGLRARLLPRLLVCPTIVVLALTRSKTCKVNRNCIWPLPFTVSKHHVMWSASVLCCHFEIPVLCECCCFSVISLSAFPSY